VNNLAGKRVLLSGAAGFIGANLLRRLLAEQAQVTALVRPDSNLWRLPDLLPDVNLQRVDLLDGEALHRLVDAVIPHIIFHLAFSGGHAADTSSRFSMLQNGLLGTFNLLEALRPVKFEQLVCLGSFLETGPLSTAHSEEDPLAPITFRGAVKASQSLLCQQFAREAQRPVSLLRIFSVYGPWESPGRLVPKAILAALQGRSLPLTEPGFQRDLVFVADVVTACLQAAITSLPPGEVINIGSGKSTTNEAVVELIARLSGREIKVKTGKHPTQVADTRYCRADIQKAARLLAWQPTFSLEDGLLQTISWFEHNLERYSQQLSA
jgi:nucleoside-diphosphate-sugar epimerase